VPNKLLARESGGVDVLARLLLMAAEVRDCTVSPMWYGLGGRIWVVLGGGLRDVVRRALRWRCRC
jgi:hypothetical protein